MRLSYFLILFTLFFSPQTIFAAVIAPATPVSCTITSVLKLGAKGPEVECLQGKMGVKADGNFGRLTSVAVMAFQTARGLKADGIIGPISRAILNNNDVTAGGSTYPEGCVSAAGYSPTTGAKCDGSLKAEVPNSQNSAVGLTTNNNNMTIPKPPETITSNTASSNPSFANLDQFTKTVVEVERKKGTDDKTLKLIADTLRSKITSSNVDYNKKFEELLVQESKLGINTNNQKSIGIFNKIISKTLSLFDITPSIAQAATGTPFGGALLSSYGGCLNPQTWAIAITPLPPTFAALLSYVPGTQGFASYNIPSTRNLLGMYTGVGLCVLDWYPYVAFDTQGTITPMTGSSPL